MRYARRRLGTIQLLAYVLDINFQVHVPLDVGVFLCIINLCIFVFIPLFRRLHNLDVEVAASGFTRDMSESFDEVKTCEDTFIANREGREEMTHPSQVSYCNTFF